MMLKESLSSKHQTPQYSHSREQQIDQGLGAAIVEDYGEQVQHVQSEPVSRQVISSHQHLNQSEMPEEPEDLIEEEQSSEAVMTERPPSQLKDQIRYKPEPYNIEEIEHLFMDGDIPEELLDIEDPLQFNYLLVKFKKDFNDRTHSDFLKYMNLELPYISKRDECGGIISHGDWNDFTIRLTKMKD